ncbi:hypothetical protein DMENIID0001_060630 [Sergentomyia squamirostris]
MFVISLSKTLLLISVLIVTSSIKDVSAIKCYQCNSALDIECKNVDTQNAEMYQHFYKECPIQDEVTPFCRKIEVELLGREIPEERIIRTCGYISANKRKSCYEFTTDNHFQLECECNQDGCNSSTRLKTTSFLLLFVPLIAFIRAHL